MVNIGLMPLIMDRCRQACREPNLSVHPAQEECTEVRRQGPAFEIGPDGLATDRRKTQLRWARIGHKQTSCGFSGMVGSHLPFYQRLTRGLSIFMKNSGYIHNSGGTLCPAFPAMPDFDPWHGFAAPSICRVSLVPWQRPARQDIAPSERCHPPSGP